MPDYEITLTCYRAVVDGQQSRQPWLKSVRIENISHNLAVPKGIDEIMNWAEEEIRDNPENKPVPIEAIAYWRQARANGNLLMYEIQSVLESNWNITFGLQELSPAIEVQPVQTHNGHRPKPPTNTGTEPLDLDSLLKTQLKALQDRQKKLDSDRERIDDEYDRNQEQIAKITQFLTINQPPKRKKKEKGGDEDRADNR